MSEHDWNTFVATCINPNFLQAWQWSKIKKMQGWDATYFQGSEAGAQILIKNIARGRLRIGYAPRGPVFLEHSSPQKALDEMLEFCKSKGIDHLSIDALVDIETDFGKDYAKSLAQCGYSKAKKNIQMPNTGVVDTDTFNNRDELIATFSKSRRTLVRKTLKSELFFTKVQGIETIKEFHALYEETGQAKGFSVRSPEYMQSVMRAYQADTAKPGARSDSFIIASRTAEGRLVSAGFFVGFADTLSYFYGASHSERQLSAASNLTQLIGIEEAKKRGYRYYDMVGAPNSLDDPTDPFHGVWVFKASFGPRFFRSPGCWEKPLSPRGKVFQKVRKFR